MHDEIRGFPLVILTLALSLGLFMNVLDTSIANVAIPYIAGSLSVSPSQGTWIITSFAVSTAIILPLTGWLARTFGEVRLFLMSTIGFTLASVLCGLSINLPMLITSRILQGAFAAPMIPLSQSLLLKYYPKDKQGLATSLWVMTAVIAPVLGPLLGGYITDNFHWAWVFYINIPVGIFSVYFTRKILTDRETAISKTPIDIGGLCLMIICVGALQIVLDKGKDLDWFDSSIIQALMLLSVISLVLFLIWEYFEKNPIIDLSLFKIRNFTLGALALMIGFGIYFGNIVIYPLWLQTQMGYTALWAGMAVAPMGFLALIFTPIVGLSLNKYDARIFVCIGFLLFAMINFWSATFNTDVDIWHLIEPRILQGLAVSCFFSPLLFIIVSGIKPEQVASALGIANFLRILGGSFGTSIYVTLWDNREKFHHSHMVEVISNYHQNSVAQLNQFELTGVPLSMGKAMIDGVITKQSFLIAANELFWLSGYLFLFLLILIFFVKPAKKTSEQVLLVE